MIKPTIIRNRHPWLLGYLGVPPSLTLSSNSSGPSAVNNPAPRVVPAALNSGVFALGHDTPSYPILPSWPPRLPYGRTLFPTALPTADNVHVLIAPRGSGKRAFYSAVSRLPFRRPAIAFIHPQAARADTHPFVTLYRHVAPTDPTIVLLRSYADFLICDFQWQPRSILFLRPSAVPSDARDVSSCANVLIPYLGEIADVSTANPSSVHLTASFASALVRVITSDAAFPGLVGAITRALYFIVALLAR